MARAAGDDQQIAVARHRTLAIADTFAAADVVNVQHGGAGLDGAKIAEPQRGADARPDREVRPALAQHRVFPWCQVRHEHGRRLKLRGLQDGGPALGFVEIGSRPRLGCQWQMDRETGDFKLAQCLDGRREFVAVETVTGHGRLAFDDDAGAGRCRCGKRFHVLKASDGMNHPGVIRHVGEKRSPRRQHHDVSGEGVEGAGHFGIGADCDHVEAEIAGFGGKKVTAESVAVPLDDRHESGRRLGKRTDVAVPVFGIDVECEGHVYRLFISSPAAPNFVARTIRGMPGGFNTLG